MYRTFNVYRRGDTQRPATKVGVVTAANITLAKNKAARLFGNGSWAREKQWGEQ